MRPCPLFLRCLQLGSFTKELYCHMFTQVARQWQHCSIFSLSYRLTMYSASKIEYGIWVTLTWHTQAYKCVLLVCLYFCMCVRAQRSCHLSNTSCPSVRAAKHRYKVVKEWNKQYETTHWWIMRRFFIKMEDNSRRLTMMDLVFVKTSNLIFIKVLPFLSYLSLFVIYRLHCSVKNNYFSIFIDHVEAQSWCKAFYIRKEKTEEKGFFEQTRKLGVRSDG